jgi:putative ABC transport system ATP-binding protein
MNIIATRGLKKSYGKKSSRFDALKGINLDIKEGESVAIIGKSGSGKSTLMHLLALLDKPTEGKVGINGQISSRLKERKINKLRNREFGFVFQQFFMNSNDTVLNNVVLPLKIAGVSGRERKKRAMEALKTVELDDKARSKARNLSGGQKQRVCIARALVNNPKVIFADEPTGNLDSNTGKRVEDLLFSLNVNNGITLIVVTHDQDLAERCDRQIHIKDGLIESDSNRREKEQASEVALPTNRPSKKTGSLPKKRNVKKGAKQ